ncbi:LysR family transcriptional regulator [Salinicoccus bachuensis]|uniref:LysR family transcriptional regulator n=1 Tax=Salinicoccus bachuensis TaxID=3136731 RepID=A0ABZ3CH58_9STAP
MDMKHLKYFYTIAAEGQITRAAKKLHIAQPPLSQSLKNLERDIGTPLFDRNGRRMELTEAGKTLYSRCETLFQLFEETLLEVQDTGEGMKGKLNIGCVKSAFSHIPGKMKEFGKIYPDITFELREGDSASLANDLKNRRIDFAVVRLPLELDEFHHKRLPVEDYVAVLPNEWLVEGDDSTIGMDLLSALPLLLLRRTSGRGQYELILDQLKNFTPSPKVVTMCPDVDMILELVSEGVGATIVPELAYQKHNPGKVKMMKIKEDILHSESAVIWLKERYLSKSAQKFIELFDQENEMD